MAKNYKGICALLSIGALALTYSCARQELEPKGKIDGDLTTVTFRVGGASTLETKSGLKGKEAKAKQIAKINVSEEGERDQVYLVGTVQALDNIYFNDKAVTKGAPVYTETFVCNDISTVPYNGTTLYSDVKSYYSGCLEESTKTYGFDFNDGGWPESIEAMRFFFGSPVKIDPTSAAEYSATNTDNGCYGVTLDAGNNTISFNYKSPATAAAQTDILFTSKNISRTGYIANQAEYILFYHALAGVKFKSANAERETTSSSKVTTNIKSVKLIDIVSEGSCVLTPQADEYDADDNNEVTDIEDNMGSVPKSASCAVWTPSTTKSSFSIENDGIVSNSGDNLVYPETTDFEGKGSEEGTTLGLGQYNINKSDFSDTFFFIPQTTGTTTALEIVYTLTINGVESKPITKTVPFSGQDWKAGYIYTYTLSANKVDVVIADNVVDTRRSDGTVVNDRIKKDLTIKNTGNVDAYMRVAVVGNWFDMSGNIVAPWTPFSDEGRLIPTEGSESNQTYDTEFWQLKDDGYFYYKYIVKPGETIKHPLFYSYEVWDSPHDYFFEDRAHLEVDVLVQSFDAAKLTNMASNWITGFFTTEYDQ